MTRPSTANYMLGRGILYFDLFDSDGLPTGLSDMGNALSFGIQTTIEMLEHYGNRRVLRSVDREEPVSAKASGTFTLDEYDPENLALHLFGTLTGDRVNIMTAFRVRGHLRYIGAEGNDPRYIAELYRVSLKPSNPAVFLTDANEWGKLDFEFTIEDDTANHPDAPYGYVEPYVES